LFSHLLLLLALFIGGRGGGKRGVAKVAVERGILLERSTPEKDTRRAA